MRICVSEWLICDDIFLYLWNNILYLYFIFIHSCCLNTMETSRGERWDGRIEVLKFISSHENTRITTSQLTIEQPLNKIDWRKKKKIFYTQRQRRSHEEKVGETHLGYKQNPYPLGGGVTHKLENNYIAEAFPQEWETPWFWIPCQVPQPGGLGMGKRKP